MCRNAVDSIVTKEYAAGVRFQKSGHEVEERGLTGAVRADQPGDTAFGHAQSAAIDSAQPAERLGDVIDRENCSIAVSGHIHRFQSSNASILRANLGVFGTATARASG